MRIWLTHYNSALTKLYLTSHLSLHLHVGLGTISFKNLRRKVFENREMWIVEKMVNFRVKKSKFVAKIYAKKVCTLLGTFQINNRGRQQGVRNRTAGAQKWTESTQLIEKSDWAFRYMYWSGIDFKMGWAPDGKHVTRTFLKQCTNISLTWMVTVIWSWNLEDMLLQLLSCYTY